MTDKERLEKIKQDVKMTRRDLAVSPSNEITLHMDIMLNSMNYLIERVQELEKLKSAFDDLDSDYIDLQQENERYREALKEIKQLWEKSTDATDDTNLAWKMSCEAHKALESGNGDN